MRLNGEKVEVSRGVPFTHTSPLWYNLILHLFLLLLATKTNAGALEFPQHCCSQPSSNIGGGLGQQPRPLHLPPSDAPSPLGEPPSLFASVCLVLRVAILFALCHTLANTNALWFICSDCHIFYSQVIAVFISQK